MEVKTETSREAALREVIAIHESYIVRLYVDLDRARERYDGNAGRTLEAKIDWHNQMIEDLDGLIANPNYFGESA